jgi:hypothetical protein
MKTEQKLFNPMIDNEYVDMGLTLGDVKTLYNLVVTTSDIYPDDPSFQRLIVKLGMVIDDHVFSLKHDLPF